MADTTTYFLPSEIWMEVIRFALHRGDHSEEPLYAAEMDNITWSSVRGVCRVWKDMADSIFDFEMAGVSLHSEIFT